MPIRLLDLLEVPTPVPTRGGLLAHSKVYDSANNEFMHQPEVMQGTTCEVPAHSPYDCFASFAAADGDKDFHGIFTGETTTFSLYFGVDCYLQSDAEEFVKRARDGLVAGESAGIEVVGQDLLNQITVIQTATGIVDAIGQAEVYAGNHWGHLPLIHMDRAQATAGLSEHVLFPGLDWTLTTGQGTPVSNAGGFVAQDSIWVTGAASIMRGPIRTYRAVHPTLNKEMVLAERSYAMWIDCGGLQIDITP